ncbi:15581_t:CDS:1, partial [Cetraspora pellucida]
MSYDQAVKLFRQKNYDEAINLFIHSSDSNTKSLFYIGYCYEKGLGVPKNIWTAREYYEFCIEEDNSIFKYSSIFQYIHLNLSLHKSTYEKIDIFFNNHQNKDTKNQIKYFIGYALINKKYGAPKIEYLGNLYLNEAKNYLKCDINENDLLKLYKIWHYEFANFFNLVSPLIKIDFDIVDKYFNILITDKW